MATTNHARTIGLLLALVAGVGIVRVAVRARRKPVPPTPAEGARRAADRVIDEAVDRLIDETGDETFPASDPPPSWTGEPSGLSSAR
jgi:hypothetical protein